MLANSTKKQKTPDLNPNPKNCKRVEGDTSTRKRKCTDDVSSRHPFFDAGSSGLDWSPYLVISSTTQKKATTLTPFEIEDALQSSGVGKAKSVTRQFQSGLILVHVHSKQQSEALLRCTSFGGIPCTVQPHKALNSSRGVVKSRELIGCTAEDFVNRVEGITHARQVILRRDGKEIQTNTWVFTFSTPKPPTSLKIAYLELQVRPYVPNPMGIRKCDVSAKKRCVRAVGAPPTKNAPQEPQSALIARVRTHRLQKTAQSGRRKKPSSNTRLHTAAPFLKPKRHLGFRANPKWILRVPSSLALQVQPRRSHLCRPRKKRNNVSESHPPVAKLSGQRA